MFHTKCICICSLVALEYVFLGETGCKWWLKHHFVESKNSKRVLFDRSWFISSDLLLFYHETWSRQTNNTAEINICHVQGHHDIENRNKADTTLTGKMTRCKWESKQGLTHFLCGNSCDMFRVCFTSHLMSAGIGCSPHTTLHRIRGIDNGEGWT